MLPPRATSTLLGALFLTSLLAFGAPTAGAPTIADAAPGSLTVATETPAARATAPRIPPLYVDPYSAATRQEPRFAKIARTPQAVWFTDGVPINRIHTVAEDYLDRAKRVRRTGTMVVYAIPDRDCGGHSSGGLPDATSYRQWIRQLAAGIKGHRPLLVLEPDAVAFSSDPACGDVTQRMGLLRYATRVLTDAGAWVYIDAGHSAWTPYAGRADLLRRAGVAIARGFSTNVANFRTSAQEHRYAAVLLRQLRGMGVRGVHYVVDTSRNGNGRPLTGDVFNPRWARLGVAPRLLWDGAFDARLWIKRPGESDGAVNGGPNAGQWCDTLADRLMGRAGTGAC